MKSWHIENLARIKLVESVLRKNEGEVKLKMSKVAISSTDFAYFASDAPDKNPELTVPGHSAVAYMSEDCDALGLKMGARAVISPYVRYEEHGVKKVSVLGVDRDGLLSDFVSVPAENVYALPDGIPDDEAILPNTSHSATMCSTASRLTRATSSSSSAQALWGSFWRSSRSITR